MTNTPPTDEFSQVLYRGMDREALDAAYNNSAAVTGSAEIVAGWREVSAKVRTRPSARLDLSYGERPRMTLDYFPCGVPNAPLFAFIHGGYWQRNDKNGFSVFALGPLAHGIDVAMLGYTLAPEVCLGTIVNEISDSLDYLGSHAGDFGFDSLRLFVGGWSAGGHLTAMMLSHPHVRGGLAISGIFDLEPISLSYLNEPLSLSEDQIADLSPILLIDPSLAPVRVVFGGEELSELHRQSEDYAAAASAAGMSVSLRMAQARNHFTMLEELREPDGGLTQDLIALIDAA
jgi:arylformamidase